MKLTVNDYWLMATVVVWVAGMWMGYSFAMYPRFALLNVDPTICMELLL